MATATQYRVIGTRPIRPDGYGKVTGKDQYGADIILPGMLYCKVLRSPHPHAIIKAIDVSKALALPGVMAVVTGDDLPRIESSEKVSSGEETIEARFMTALCLAQDKVYFKGQPVAAVAATSLATAREALSLIEVEYEPLPVVDDVLEAMKEDAPLLHGDLYTESLAGKGSKPSNIAGRVEHTRGDVDKGMAEADVVIEREFRTQMVHQGYIEPTNSTAYVAPDGRITIWTSTQGAWDIRNQVATILQIPEGMIRVIPMEIGGGFGGKFTAYLDPVVVLLSQKTGRPVKAVMTRAEVFQATGPSSGTYIRLKMGAKRDGTLVAADAFMVYDAGAFPGSPVGGASVTGLSPYNIPNFKIVGFDVVTNRPRVKAYRAPGATAIAFAVETVLDEIAERLGIDPVDLRLKNAVGPGDRMTNGVPYPSIGFRELLTAVKEHPHYNAPLEGKWAGRGFAAGFWMNGSGVSTVHLTFNTDGTVNLIEGSTDIGGTRATMAQIVAEELWLEMDEVKPMVGDTQIVGFNDGTGGSRTTYSTGVAVWKACQNAIAEFKVRAARMLEVDAEEIVFEAGDFKVKSNPERSVNIREVIRNLRRTGGHFEAVGVSGGLKMAPAFGASLVDLAVDPETGKVEILRWTQFQDVGKAIHPSYVEGQLQGGAAQGIGWALYEEYIFKDGHMLNPTFLDYRMPTALDLPMIDTCIIEVPASDGPYGVRGVGEVSIVPPPAAIANAIYRATGVRMNELPMTSERIWRAMSQRQSRVEQEAS